MSQRATASRFPMKASPTVLSLLSAVLLATSLAQVEFVGFMTSAEGSRFALKEEKGERASGWLALGDSFRGFKLIAHDPQRDTLVVEKEGERLELHLKKDRVAHGEAQKVKIADIAIQFKGEATTVTAQQVRDSMQLRPGDALEEAAIDRSIRALYRTGHFEFVEFKNERLTPDTFRLVVIVTPKSK